MDAYFVDEPKCGSWMLHEPHSFRKGFMWLIKKECDGQDKVDPLTSFIPLRIIEHKHDYKLQSAYSFGPKRDSDILWLCDWAGCNNYFVTERKLWWDKGVWYDLPF